MSRPVLLRGLMWAMGVACVGIGLAHLVLGIHSVPGLDAAGATVDSRERFYGAIFACYGVAWVTAARLRPAPARAVGVLAGALLLGGVGRALSWVEHGRPHWFQVVLLVTELVLPPVFWWLARAAAPTPTDRRAREPVP